MSKSAWARWGYGFCGCVLLLAGCTVGPTYINEAERRPVDRALVEYPNGFVMKAVVTGITGGAALALVSDEGEYHNAILIAERGMNGDSPRIYGFKADGAYFNIYPRGNRVPTFGLLHHANDLYAPIGGMCVSQGHIYVTHRDASGNGVVSCFGFDGSHQTVVADLPARGDYSLTDIIVHPTTGRLYFGLGAATNSGVVGIDNWQAGWLKKYPKFCDLPAGKIKLFGYRFDTKNPVAGLFGGDDIAVTAPYQPFGTSNQLRISEAPNAKPTAAIYSISPTGGDLRVEAQGVRLPRGLAFNEYAILFATNNGMEMRGTRPVKDDPDSFLKILPNTNYGWPDFSADLFPINDTRFQPPTSLVLRTGYPEIAYLIDHESSGLLEPSLNRETLLFGTFPALSGAAKMDFTPSTGGFREFRGNAIVTLSGDHAPFATGGQKLKAPVGFKVVRLDLDNRRVEDFIRNTSVRPSRDSEVQTDALQRPTDAKFGPDGKLYILDFGQLEMRGGQEKIVRNTGRLYVLEALPQPAPTTGK